MQYGMGIVYLSFWDILFPWWQVKSDCFMLKMAFVGAIAKWFVARQAAAAKRNKASPAQIIGLAFFIYHFKISLYFKRAIAVYCNFRCSHFIFFRNYIEVQTD